VADVLVTVTACSLLSAFVFFLLWREALSDARYWKADSDHWFDAWMKASKRRPRRNPADYGGPGVSPGSKKGGGNA
jgi:hypothetical protein